jgi:adenosylmethionine-8-amino-7-oxononanoate aminotransferase
MLAPPFIVTEAELDEIVARLKIALDRTLEKTNVHR